MNMAVTDGIQFMPPSFSDGLDHWSSGDGTPGDPSLAGAANASLVTGDQDFGDCLEIQTVSGAEKLRAFAQTPIFAGVYLRVSTRIKILSGNIPSVRVAGWAGAADGTHVAGLVETGPSVMPTAYGEVVEVSAIVGTGQRGGVDMPWGLSPAHGHFGIDIIGTPGAVVRIEDIRIEDVTRVYLREMMDWVDVRDYGAVGDGVTDDTAAFMAADAAAAGRAILVPAGTYFLSGDLTLQHPVRFEGMLMMPDDKVLSLVRGFDLPTYVAAFGNETLALRKALQALFHFTDHEALDLGGMRVSVEAPIDVQAAVGDLLSFSNRRVIRNGQLEAVAGPAWDTVTVSSTASYDPSSPTRLSNVANVANIPVGARVIGAGVGREVYVRDRNVSAGTLTLSKPLYGAAGTNTFQFERFQYILDFSGFEWLSRFVVADVEFKCDGIASGLMLARDGLVTHVRDCFFTEPKDRGITSIGSGCQGMLVDRCQFLSNEQSLNAQDRTSIAINTNANDVKIRDNRFVRFRHAMVLGGSGNIIQGNHAFQGDNQPQGTRLASIVLGQINPKTVINGNYIDNSWIEWTNEFDATPDFASGFSFGNLSIVGNMFTANDVGNWFRWIVIRPHGQGQFINGLSICDNVFKSLNGSVDRFEGVDASIAPLDMSRARNIRVEGNAFNNVTAPARNPVTIDLTENTPAATWAVDLADFLPFGGIVRVAESLVAVGPVRDAGGSVASGFPYVKTGQGATGTELHVVWPQPVEGKVQITARMDNPN